MKIKINPPKSLVKYPRATIITLWILILALPLISAYKFDNLVWSVISIALVIQINDREEYIKGYKKCAEDIYIALTKKDS